MSLNKHSPHLSSLLRRSCPESDYPILDTIFQFSLDHGGALEEDFIREPGVSYNPRAARVPVILIQNAGINDSQVLGAGMLASLGREAPYPAQFPRKVVELARNALQTAEHITRSASREVQTIAVCCWLDRVRHLHLAPQEFQNQHFDFFMRETEQYVTIAKSCAPAIGTLLEYWLKRYSQARLRKKVA